MNSSNTLFARKKSLKNELEHVNQEMYKRNLELAEINQTLSLLRNIDSLVLSSHEDLKALASDMAQAVVQASDYSVVAFLSYNTRKDHLELAGLAGASKHKLELNGDKISIDVSEKWLTDRHDTLLENIGLFSDKELAELSGLPLSVISRTRHTIPLQSVMIIKLRARSNLTGLMVVGFDYAKETIKDKDKLLLERLSETIGIALDNKQLFEENQHMVAQLQRSNKKLKDLDETKDEFISMASHQLRTPLTSVKGYMSMVLEGDAGKISKAQRELLNQAFVSSQRMVYLIADLLNVSRLKTGKFVIDSHPTNLAEVVETEIFQLKETAKSKQITLTYKKPAKFTELMLDETKIRQVIMNFADNAIYYTPAGGKVQIEVREDKNNVYFKVTDNGLGVPAKEKAHLFTKFYRAENARRARPDGTGLGLFMAKKVIDAQKGTLLFDSTEGKGSTFGFTFEKKKLAITE